MIQKVLKVGDSAAVTIHQRFLKELNIKTGDRITVEIDKKRQAILIKPVWKQKKIKIVSYGY